ncbi:MAG: 50S ribosomal protein L7ae [Candidatus Nanohaloarchaeota archaeon]|nr:50S ribosomal protein L7ae [Candidatus Nanohaloarchaeota archaeon]
MAILGKEIPKELSEEVYNFLESVRRSGGKIKKGVNETTKAIERGFAKLVVVAENVEPKEIVMHLPLLAKEKNIPIIAVDSKEELGKAAGIEVAASSVAVIDLGKAKKEYEALIKKIEEIMK